MKLLTCPVHPAPHSHRLRILVATIAPLRQGPAGPTSDLASARYRALIPAQQLARLGHQVQVATLPPTGWPAKLRDGAFDVLIVSKSMHTANEELARAMKARGVKIVVDFCDDHFAHPQIGPHFQVLAGLADVIVASTEAMAQAVRRNVQREAIVITDPGRGPARRPGLRAAPAVIAHRVVRQYQQPRRPGGARAGPARPRAARSRAPCDRHHARPAVYDLRG